MANEPRPEVYPRAGAIESAYGSSGPEYGWRFRDGNARITFVGGEGFTRREDAHRAFRGVAQQMFELGGLSPEVSEELAGKIEIVDVEE